MHVYFIKITIYVLVFSFIARGKQKNTIQNSIFVGFMEKKPVIGRGFTKRDKPIVDKFWQQLADSVYSAGPPQKEVNVWKKVKLNWCHK